MYDYMKSLQRQFCAEPKSEHKAEAEKLRRELSKRLDRKDRKLVLRLVDAHTMLEEEISLASFIAGFRLAVGLARELSLEEPYSFDREEERRVLSTLREKPPGYATQNLHRRKQERACRRGKGVN